MRFNLFLEGLALLTAAGGASARYLADVPPVTRLPPAVVQRQDQETTTTRSITRLEPDPWQCITENITQYFDFPTPTGAVFDAIDTYIFDQAAPCRETATGADLVSCTISDPKSWCGFTTAAPAEVVSGDYADYLSTIVSFWTKNSESISVLATSCPVAWKRFGPASHMWLDIVTAHADCYLAAHATGSQTGTDTTVTTATVPTPTADDANAATTTTTSEANLLRRAPAVEAIALMSAGLAALANAA